MAPEDAERTEQHPLLTVAEVAEMCRVSDETIHRWCRIGYLPYIEMPSGLKRIRRADVEAILVGQTAPPLATADP